MPIVSLEPSEEILINDGAVEGDAPAPPIMNITIPASLSNDRDGRRKQRRRSSSRRQLLDQKILERDESRERRRGESRERRRGDSRERRSSRRHSTSSASIISDGSRPRRRRSEISRIDIKRVQEAEENQSSRRKSWTEEGPTRRRSPTRRSAAATDELIQKHLRSLSVGSNPERRRTSRGGGMWGGSGILKDNHIKRGTSVGSNCSVSSKGSNGYISSLRSGNTNSSISSLRSGNNSYTVKSDDSNNAQEQQQSQQNPQGRRARPPQQRKHKPLRGNLCGERPVGAINCGMSVGTGKTTGTENSNSTEASDIIRSMRRLERRDMRLKKLLHDEKRQMAIQQRIRQQERRVSERVMYIRNNNNNSVDAFNTNTLTSEYHENIDNGDGVCN